MTFTEVLKSIFSNPTTMAIIGGGTSTAVITYILNKMKWIPISIYNYIANFFVSNVQITESEYHSGDYHVDKVRELEKYIRSFNNRIIRNNIKLDSEISYSKLTPGLYYIFKSLMTDGVILVIYTFMYDNKSGSGKSAIQKYNIGVVGLTYFREKFIQKLIIDLEQTTRTKSLEPYDNFIPMMSLKNNKDAIEVIRKRDMDTIFIDDKTKNTIVNHVDNWMCGREIYNKNSITYKTGIMLSGEPGTGKTSLSRAIASHMNALLMIVSTSNTITDVMNAISIVRSDEYRNRTPFDNKEFRKHFNHMTCPIVILFEEFDKHVVRQKHDNKDSDVLSDAIAGSVIQQVLQFLDGIESPENVIFIGTTNYIGDIEPSLLRPGRFDLTVNIDRITMAVADQMVRHYRPTATIHDYADCITDTGINSSRLSSRLISDCLKEANHTDVL